MTPRAKDLAGRIDEARTTRVALNCLDDQWAELDRDTAADIAADLYRRWGAESSRYWKLGAVDAATQSRLGLDGPVCAPVVPDRVMLDADRVDLRAADFIAAKFEAEVGLVVGPEIMVAACVEVADSRFAQWRLPPHGVIADGCLQSMLIFGIPAPQSDHVQVVVTHDGTDVARGEQEVQDVVQRLDVLPEDAAAAYVATGAITDLLPVVAGEWCFDFGALGRVTVVVT